MKSDKSEVENWNWRTRNEWFQFEQSLFLSFRWWMNNLRWKENETEKIIPHFHTDKTIEKKRKYQKKTTVYQQKIDTLSDDVLVENDSVWKGNISFFYIEKRTEWMTKIVNWKERLSFKFLPFVICHSSSFVVIINSFVDRNWKCLPYGIYTCYNHLWKWKDFVYFQCSWNNFD